MTHESLLLQRIAQVGVNIASPTIQQFCERLEQLPINFRQAELTALVDSFAQPEVRAALSGLLNEWQQQTCGVAPGELAWALRAANSTDEYHRLRQNLEMVWSGPVTGTSSFRRTDQALLELIQSSEHSIIVVTFAAYKVPQIAAALIAAAKRGVNVSLILESSEESNGAVTFNAIEALGSDLDQSIKVYAWPLEKRGVDNKGNHGALHAKCAVADDTAALISSANLTEYAMNLNMEVGLLVRGGDMPRALAQHLRSLIQSGILVVCRK